RSAQERASLMHGFLPFRLWVGSGHDPASNRKMELGPLDHKGAYEDVAIEVPTVAPPGDAPAISSSGRAFERCDQLHRAALRAAGDRGARKESQEEIEGILALWEKAL